MHKDQDFANQLHACSIKPQTLTITALNTVVIRFWDNEQTDFAELKLTVPMSEKDKQVDFDHTKWSYNHLNFVREASLTNGVINVFCNNVADFVDIYTNGSTKNAEQIDYRVVNTFSFAAPAIEVKDINSVIGKTFNFVEGVATVEGSFVKVNWQNAKLIDKVMHNNSDYTSQINACKVSVRTITFVSAASAVIRFYENNSNDYAELTAAVKVTESEKPIVFERTDWSYMLTAAR